ncbi:MAG TPA: hypothetical protein VK335_01875 [Bryobacteraceae bacterium]|nr:hypothetical protein [Bryobacteraceae bacterium]
MANRINRAIAGAICVALSLGGAQAGEKISWDQLADRVASQSTTAGVVENRSVAVITIDGRAHHTRKLCIDTEGVKLDHGSRPVEVLLRRDVSRIEIRQRGRYIRRITYNAEMALFVACVGFSADEGGGGPLALLSPVVSIPFWAYTAASAPVFLAAEGVALFRPARVFEIMQ